MKRLERTVIIIIFGLSLISATFFMQTSAVEKSEIAKKDNMADSSIDGYIDKNNKDTVEIIRITNEDTKVEIDEIIDIILTSGDREFYQGNPIDDSFLLWLCNKHGEAVIWDIANELCRGNCDEQVWYENTGSSIRVLWLEYCRDLRYSTYLLEDVVWVDSDAHDTTDSHSVDATNNENSIQIDLIGDINLANDWYTMEEAKTKNKGIEDCIAENVRTELEAADITVANNEFCYADEGTPLAGKTYTFRADTENVALLDTFSVDLVSVANNHVFDYGEEGLLTTLETLDGAEIPYIGAGKNIDEASAVKYYVVKGRKIAFVSATEIEKFAKYTKEATVNSPGVLKTIDTTLFCNAISEAKDNADYVIAYVHWGIEGENDFGTEQRKLATAYVNAGADAVIGGHPHRLQGAEFINGVPVAYSLGNFWFSTGTIYTTIAQIRIDEGGELSLAMLPCIQKDVTTSMLTDENDIKAFYEYVADVSYGVGIDDSGRFYDSFDEAENELYEDELVYRSGKAYAIHSDLIDLEGRAIDIVGNLE